MKSQHYTEKLSYGYHCEECSEACMDQWCHVNDHVIVFSRVHDVKELVQHIQSHHETEVTSHIKKFDSMAQFEEWKKRLPAMLIL